MAHDVQAPRRVVAIVGRPNVGKSAIFNRIIGRRLSIVHEESGVTRDRLNAEAEVAGEKFQLVDTGGLGQLDNARGQDRFDEGIRQQIDVAIRDAAVFILVVDVEAGVVPLDREVARLLREAGRPVFVAANKADHPSRDARAEDCAELGYPVYPVSALHSRGFDPLLRDVVGELPPPVEEAGEEPLRVAVVGKPNAGKSSYINRLLRSNRVLVSEVPGTTRDSIEIPFRVGRGKQARSYLLMDTAGLKRKGKVKDVVEMFSMMRAEESIRRADVVVLVLDAEVGPSAHDKKISSLIHRHEKGSVLLVNKWDRMEGTTQRAYLKALAGALPFLQHVPVVFASAHSGYNIRRSVDAIDHVAAQVRSKLATGVLNRVLHDAINRRPPTAVDGRRMKLFYATQTGTQPLRITLFVNHPRRVNENYRRYLVHALRDAFGLEGAPVILRFRARSRDHG